MANVLNAYDPQYYVNQALMWLSNNLGMASTVYRDAEFESIPANGSTGKMRRPATFAATAVNTSTGGTTQDVDTEVVTISYDNWQEVKFAVYEDELSDTGDRFINEHIAPAANAVADAIDQSLFSLYKYVPSSITLSSTVAVSDITNARKQLFNQKVPMTDMNRYLAVDGNTEAALLNLTAFTQNDGSGQVGVDSQINGFLGRRFGFGIFAAQNIQTHASGTMADTAGTLTGDHAKGATSVTLGALTDADTIKPGDTFSIAGSSQEYSYAGTATVTVASSAAVLSPISPPLQQDYSGTAVVTLVPEAGSGGSKVTNLAYHRNAFGLKFAQLPMIGNELGARVYSQVDPISGLALRARLWYEGNTNAIKVSLDARWAAVALNPLLACRVRAN